MVDGDPFGRKRPYDMRGAMSIPQIPVRRSNAGDVGPWSLDEERLTPSGESMNDTTTLSEYLVISRGQWDKDRSLKEIQKAIDDFYLWHDRLVSKGVMKAGQRLAREAKVVSSSGVVDGPFTEGKEIVGGYWFFLAGSLAEAATLAAQNPCLACGLTYEVRPIEAERASAFKLSSEMPENFGHRE
jgi:hypothetical protein